MTTIPASENNHIVARDNVIFEAGMFMGMHGRQRTFIVTPRATASFHLPSDCQGFTTVSYDPADLSLNSVAALAPGVTQIKKAMTKAAEQQADVDIQSFVSLKLDATYPYWLVDLSLCCGEYPPEALQYTKKF